MKIERGEIWNNTQKAGCPIHATSYYGSFQPALPEFFINRYTQEGNTVFDPFSGRGTTPVQAALMNRHGFWHENNPYGRCLIIGKEAMLRFDTAKRLRSSVAEYLEKMYNFTCHFRRHGKTGEEMGLLNFFHENTLAEIEWIKGVTQNPSNHNYVAKITRMLMCLILTGHSPGYLSVRTLPPNMQISVERQVLLNAKHKQKPEARNVHDLLLARLDRMLVGFDFWKESPINQITHLKTETFQRMDMILFSPPFLNVIKYQDINWIRNWWLGESPVSDDWSCANVEDWAKCIKAELLWCKSLLAHDGCICVEAGKVRKDKVNLIEIIIDQAELIGLRAVKLYLQETGHTRTAKCWGVNSDQGTRSQQVVVLRPRW